MSKIDKSRRAFLQALPAAPVAAKTVVGALLENAAAVAQAGQLADAGMTVSKMNPLQFYGLRDPRILAAYRAGLLPDWAKDDIRREAAESARHLSPDVASLRSVSLSAKKRIQARRNESEIYATADIWGAWNAARRAFYGESP